MAPDQYLNSALIFEREWRRDQASTLCSQNRLQSKLIITAITIDCALSKLIVEQSRSRPSAYEISLSRNRILIKLFYDLNPGNALNVMGDDWRNRGLA
ncbi:MAG TPA: hypothetical protein VE715_11115 [Blastocatellia bacterium]|nr:hypothetical protein [Blastocatellia bacterium]